MAAEQREPLWRTFASLPAYMARVECEPVPLPPQAPRGAVGDYVVVYSCHGSVCRGKGMRPEFRSLAEVVNHMDAVEGLELLPCRDCGREIWAPRLGEHAKAVHRRAPHFCDVCYKHVASAADHRWHCHCGRAVPTLQALQAHARDIGHAVTACYACGRGFATPAAMHQHKAAVHHRQ